MIYEHMQIFIVIFNLFSIGDLFFILTPYLGLCLTDKNIVDTHEEPYDGKNSDRHT